MSLPRKDFSGEEATVTIVELRQAPGDLFDRVAHGMTVRVTKHGRCIAIITPPDTTINRDGSWTGARPLTHGLNPNPSLEREEI